MYFDNIIGQDFAKKYLTNSIKKNKINHAYMFEGIDGIGKNFIISHLDFIVSNRASLILVINIIIAYSGGSSYVFNRAF